VQVGVNNIRLAVSENRMQSGVYAVVESRAFAQVSNFYASLLQQTVEVASQPPRERNYYWFISLAVQPSHDMNRYALGAAGAEHRDDMDYSYFVHDLSSRVALSHSRYSNFGTRR